MRYKYEFEADQFEIGNCNECPLGCSDDDYNYYCSLGYPFDECPLEEVDDLLVYKVDLPKGDIDLLLVDFKKNAMLFPCTSFKSYCDECPNNTKNGGNGNCNCILGLQQISY